MVFLHDLLRSDARNEQSFGERAFRYVICDLRHLLKQSGRTTSQSRPNTVARHFRASASLERKVPVSDSNVLGWAPSPQSAALAGRVQIAGSYRQSRNSNTAWRPPAALLRSSERNASCATL